ncbi:MmgE/PrpD family protein [Thermodesulfobacteriota bacterium]
MESTRKFAEFLVNITSEEIPKDALLLAKKAFIDCLGVSVTGSCTESAVLMRQFVREIGSQGQAGVISGSFRCHPSLAALANGVSAHALDYDDVIRPVGHASAVLVPVGLALGEEMNLTGKDILEAYILGVEVGVKLASCMCPEHAEKGWHTTGTLGTVTAGAMAARLLRLDVDKTCSALSLAASQAAGIRLNFGSMAKPFHAGNAARSGITAALLSQKGFSGRPETYAKPNYNQRYQGNTGRCIEQSYERVKQRVSKTIPTYHNSQRDTCKSGQPIPQQELLSTNLHMVKDFTVLKHANSG